MIAFVYKIDAEGREQLPGRVSTAYQSIRALERYWLRKSFLPGRYRVYLHHGGHRKYDAAHRIALISIAEKEPSHA
jgi:hypothetical protein